MCRDYGDASRDEGGRRRIVMMIKMMMKRWWWWDDEVGLANDTEMGRSSSHASIRRKAALGLGLKEGAFACDMLGVEVELGVEVLWAAVVLFLSMVMMIYYDGEEKIMLGLGVIWA